jgi:hypothetical protein
MLEELFKIAKADGPVLRPGASYAPPEKFGIAATMSDAELAKTRLPEAYGDETAPCWAPRTFKEFVNGSHEAILKRKAAEAGEHVTSEFDASTGVLTKVYKRDGVIHRIENLRNGKIEDVFDGSGNLLRHDRLAKGAAVDSPLVKLLCGPRDVRDQEEYLMVTGRVR